MTLDEYSRPERRYPGSLGPQTVRDAVSKHAPGGDPFNYAVTSSGYGHASVMEPSGEGLVSPAEVLRIREEVLRRLGEVGLQPGRELRSSERSTWDRIVGESLLEQLEIHSFQAFDDEFWTYMTLHVFWDFPNWRFPGKRIAVKMEEDSEDETNAEAIGLRRAEDRIFGGRRNVLFRVWFRAHVLGPELAIPGIGSTGHVKPAGEDILDNLFGRPSVCRNHELARAIMAAFYRNAPTGSGRHHVFREFMKAIRRRFTSIHFVALGDDLGGVLDDLWRDSSSRVVAVKTNPH